MGFAFSTSTDPPPCVGVVNLCVIIFCNVHLNILNAKKINALQHRTSPYKNRCKNQCPPTFFCAFHQFIRAFSNFLTAFDIVSLPSNINFLKRRCPKAWKTKNRRPLLSDIPFHASHLHYYCISFSLSLQCII